LHGITGAVESEKAHAQFQPGIRFDNENANQGRKGAMKLKDKIKQAGAAGYILLWLLGIPIPVLLLIFLLRGCS
jgi:hypothetical protein